MKSLVYNSIARRGPIHPLLVMHIHNWAYSHTWNSAVINETILPRHLYKFTVQLIQASHVGRCHDRCVSVPSREQVVQSVTCSASIMFVFSVYSWVVLRSYNAQPFAWGMGL